MKPNLMQYTIIKIAGSSAHSAFTDLCLWNGELYCCFREAQNHISNDGRICIVRLDLAGKVLNKTYIAELRSDLRDPKLSITPDNQLMLLVYQRQFKIEGQIDYCKPTVYFSNTGKSWSSPKHIGDNFWWLWRLRWHTIQHATSQFKAHQAYGFAYNRAANRIHLYSGDPKSNFHIHSESVLSLAQHQLGYPNESDIMFDGLNARAIVRRDADTCSAQLGESHYPFKQWQWTDLGAYLGGPCLVEKGKNSAWVAGRIWRNYQFKTALLSLNFTTKKLKLEAELPSAGDNSYPGLVFHSNRLYMSYYSSHEDNKSQIYLAQFDISED